MATYYLSQFSHSMISTKGSIALVGTEFLMSRCVWCIKYEKCKSIWKCRSGYWIFIYAYWLIGFSKRCVEKWNSICKFNFLDMILESNVYEPKGACHDSGSWKGHTKYKLNIFDREDDNMTTFHLLLSKRNLSWNLFSYLCSLRDIIMLLWRWYYIGRVKFPVTSILSIHSIEICWVDLQVWNFTNLPSVPLCLSHSLFK